MAVEELRNFMFTSIISADNEEYTEEQKQEVISRYELEKGQPDIDWEFVLEPIKPNKNLLNLFK